MNKVMHGAQILALLAEIRDLADGMLCKFDCGGNTAHAFWLHVDGEILDGVRDLLDDMDTAMRDEVRRIGREFDGE